MSQPVEPVVTDRVAPAAAPLLGPVRYLLALTPVWYWLAVELVRPGTMAPLGENPPGVLGIAIGLVVLAVAVVLMLAGLAAVRSARSTARVLTPLVLLTIPSLLLVAVGPLVVSTLQRMG